jgi:membrane-bound lytic murein transglycosylase A
MAMAISGPVSGEARLLDWSELHGWPKDDHSAALAVFRETCRDLKEGDWSAVCALSNKDGDARTYFETFFRPVLITDGTDALFTGYFEPELAGSLQPSERFRFPLYRRPDDVPEGNPWLTREEIETSGVLEDRGLEIVWLEDAVDKFFLQIQGSGRIILEGGGSLRVGYGGKNGHPYRSVGVELVRRGVFQDHQVSAETIRRWVKSNPRRGPRLLWHNPSYVFFREVNQLPADKGPLGAMNRSVTAGRTIAVDPEFVPLGAPVWIEKDGDAPLRRLMVAQDTGSAIKGAQRADIFFGTGDEAGDLAGRVRDGGRMVVLLPVQLALSLTDGA